jgi:hypothetical protein
MLGESEKQGKNQIDKWTWPPGNTTPCFRQAQREGTDKKSAFLEKRSLQMDVAAMAKPRNNLDTADTEWERVQTV